MRLQTVGETRRRRFTLGLELPVSDRSPAASGIGGMVTICTRVDRFAGILEIAERFDNVYCSVRLHPHEAAAELHLTPEPLLQLSRPPTVTPAPPPTSTSRDETMKPRGPSPGFTEHPKLNASRKTVSTIFLTLRRDRGCIHTP